ncbi:MAG: carbohydrate ABC transporter permease [Christensenellales bacterium]|jgi:raffinose/stachyose/melibiose transport system permease protein
MTSRRRSQYLISLLFLLPALTLLFVFIVYPLIETAVLSTQSWKGIYGTHRVFVGIANYSRVLRSDTFWNAMLNSFYFMLGAFVVLMPLAFALALFVTSSLKFTNTMKTIYYLPVILGATTVALMWRSILNPNSGVLAGMLMAAGQEKLIIDWLNTPPLNVWITVLINEWKYAGYNMLIFAAGLSSIPQSVVEAARIDGCTSWQTTRYVKLPLLKNSFKVFSILAITGCLKVFDIIWAMTAGGPNDASATPGILVYKFAYEYKRFGRSAAIAVMLLVLGVTLSVILNKLMRQDDDIYA